MTYPNSSSSPSNCSQIPEREQKRLEHTAERIDAMELSPSATANASANFFGNHKQLKDKHAEKVVRFARRRLDKRQYDVEIDDAATHHLVPVLSHSQVKINKVLGQGSFSTVYSVSKLLANDPDSHEDDSSACNVSLPPADGVVVKVLRKQMLLNAPMFASCAADLVKEGKLLTRLQHPNVIQVLAHSPNGVRSYTNGRHDAYFLLLSKLDTTLQSKLTEWRDLKQSQGRLQVLKSKQHKRDKLDLLEEKLNLVTELGKAVAYLHSKSVLHRDLKPDNIGFDANGTLKVFDFDVARTLPATRPHPSETFMMTKRIGSPRYMSPECAKGEPYNAKTDVYSYTLVAYEILSLVKPYEDVPSDWLDSCVFDHGVRPYVNQSWPEPLQEFLHQGWDHNFHNRPTMIQAASTWESLIPTVLADKERKYFKYAWLLGADERKYNKDIPPPKFERGDPIDRASAAIRPVEFSVEFSAFSQVSRVSTGSSSAEGTK